MARLTWTDQAITDLDDIAEYIAKDSLKHAKAQVKRIREHAQQLKSKPNSSRIVPEFQDPTIRELIQGNYRIIHRLVSEKRVDILLVHHTSRLLRKKHLKK